MAPQADLPPGIDYEGVSRFFAANVPGGDGPITFTLISGGRSNLTYLVASGDQRWVLRRPPIGHALPTAHDMAREHRILSAIAGTPVPAPHPVAFCADSSVNEHPFYVMDYREGIIVTEGLPPGFAETLEDRRRMSLALVRTLVDLHAVDYTAVGLADFGRPEGYVERQVRRWGEQWERSKTRELPPIEELIRRLRAAIPESPSPTIVHGDYRFGNIMLDAKDPGRIVAILDWEMCTLGDPLADLGYTLLYWGEMADSAERLAVRSTAAVTAQPGFLTRAELTAEYARLSGRDVSAIDFYIVLAYYKLAVICEGIHNRYVNGQTVGEGFEDYDVTATNLVNVALEIADKSELPALRGR
jgi:aminoglycoside phosphotransferase (APT) family kinase protein